MRILSLTLILMTPLLAQDNPISKALQSRWATAKLNLVEAAKAMPAPEYAFKLTPAQRSYGDWVGHTASLFEGSCNAMIGKTTPPMDHSAHAAHSSKAELIAMLESAGTACDAAFASMDDAKLIAPVTEKKVLPINPALGLLVNASSHYGNMVGYLRSKGVTPPSTARAAAAAKK